MQRIELGAFAMITQLNAKVMNGSHNYHEKSSVLKLKIEDNDCVFLRYPWNYSSERQAVNGSIYLSVTEQLWKKIHHVRPKCPTAVGWFVLHDNAMDRFTRQFRCNNF